MKKWCISMVILFCICFQGIAQQIPVEELEIARVFSVGSGPDELMIRAAGPLGVPYRPFFGRSVEEIFIFDILNERFVFLDELLEVKDEVHFEIDFDITPYQVQGKSNIYLLASGLQGFALFNETTGELIELWQNDFPEFRDYRSFAYYGDVLFVHDKDLNLWSIPEPGLDEAENRSKLLDQARTIAYVNQRWGDTGEVRVDDQGRLFIDGELVTRDFPAWSEFYRGVSTDVSRTYVGIDKFENTYWVGIGLIQVFSPNMNRFTFEFDSRKVSGYPAVDYQTGNLYFLGRPVDGQIPLYRISRDW